MREDGDTRTSIRLNIRVNRPLSARMAEMSRVTGFNATQIGNAAIEATVKRWEQDQITKTLYPIEVVKDERPCGLGVTTDG